MTDSETSAKTPTDWRNTVILALGVWLFISPGFLDFNTIGSATGNTAALGAIMTVLGGIAMRAPRKWVLWAVIACSAWMVIAPFALDFQAHPTPMWNSVISGLVCAALAAWQFVAPQLTKTAAAE